MNELDRFIEKVTKKNEYVSLGEIFKLAINLKDVGDGRSKALWMHRIDATDLIKVLDYSRTKEQI